MKVVVLRKVDQARYEVVDGEIDLQIGGEAGVGARRQVGSARRECGDGFGAGLSEHAQLLFVRVLTTQTTE